MRSVIWKDRASIGMLSLPGGRKEGEYKWWIIPTDEPMRLQGAWDWIYGVPSAEVEVADCAVITYGTKVRNPVSNSRLGDIGVVTYVDYKTGRVQVQFNHGDIVVFPQDLTVLPKDENRIEWLSDGKGVLHLDPAWAIECIEKHDRWNRLPTVTVEGDKFHIGWNYVRSISEGTRDGGEWLINGAHWVPYVYQANVIVAAEKIQEFLNFPAPWLIGAVR